MNTNATNPTNDNSSRMRTSIGLNFRKPTSTKITAVAYGSEIAPGLLIGFENAPVPQRILPTEAYAAAQLNSRNAKDDPSKLFPLARQMPLADREIRRTCEHDPAKRTRVSVADRQ